MNTQLSVRSSDFIRRQGRFWMPAQILGEKIGYEYPRQSISKIYNRNEDELEPFTGEVKMATPQGEQLVRCFDEQGCYIVAMLAKTEQAKVFRQGLARFLQKLKAGREHAMQLRFQIADMHQEYAAIKTKTEREKLQATINRTDWTWHRLERMDAMHASGMLSWAEIGKVFGYNATYLQKLNKRYRMANGDIEDRPQPKALREANR